VLSLGPLKESSNGRTMLFTIALSFSCALILSLLASALAKPKEIAKELDRSKEMLMAAKILSREGYFLTKDASQKPATQEQIIEVYTHRLQPLLTDDKGQLKTFKELNIDESAYLAAHRKSGYYKMPWKLLYAIAPEQGQGKPIGYVIPVNGYGLWDAIYGYMALKTDGDTVIGISWYDQKETPGLGANITEAYWQDLFANKKIFQQSPDGKTDIHQAPLGITVAKGKVADVYGMSPKANSAVDGMTGATLTGYGVTDAYRDVLAGYRPFLEKLYKENGT
jgi:Na+-transporting NADH:ubiquinone oxidoreductase subunit C